MHRFLCSSTALLVICGALAGCATSDDAAAPATSSLASAAAGTTQLRIVHASATSGAFDIYTGADPVPAFTGVGFGAATTYIEVPAGDTALAFRTAGAPGSAAPVFSTQVVVNEGETVTAVAAGLLGSSLATVRFRVTGFVEQFGAANPHQARLRFVQASHGLPSAGFDVGDDGAIEVADLPAFAASDAAGLKVRAAHAGMQLAITSGAPATRRTAFTLPGAVTTAASDVFVVLAGLPTFKPRESRGLTVIAVTHDEAIIVKQNPTVFVVPVVPDRAAIDIAALGGGIGVAQVATAAGFAAIAPLQVPPTEHGVHLVFLDSQRRVPIALAPTGPLAAGERYLAVASGFATRHDAARPRVRVDVFAEAFTAPLSGPGYLRAVAASPGAPLLDVGSFPAGDGTQLRPLPELTALAYRTASAAIGTQAPAAPLNPGVKPTGTDTALRFAFGALAPADRAFGVIAGAWQPQPGEVGPRFVVIKTPASGEWSAQALAPQ